MIRRYIKVGVNSILLLFTYFSYSQSYFSKRFDIAGRINEAGRLRFYNDTFYIPSMVFETTGPITISTCLLKISKTGTIIEQKRFKQINKNYEGYTDLYIRNKRIYVSGITNIASTPALQCGLYVFNQSCDTVFTKPYGDTSYYNGAERIQPYLKTKNKILLFGLTDSTCGHNSGKHRPFIRVVDTNGVLYQTKLYLTTNVNRTLTSSDTTLNKGYIFSGVENSKNYIVKLDSNLNLQWVNYFSNNTISVFNGIKTLKSGKHIMAHCKTDYVSGGAYFDRVGLTKLDTNGNIIWQKFYGTSQTNIGATAVKELKNKDFIVCGVQQVAYTPSVSQAMGFLMRTDSMGNLKWWLNYVANDPVKDTIADNYLYDVLQMPDGGFAAAGTVFGTFQFSTIEQSWLLRVDSMGCLVSGCNPYVAGIKQVTLNKEEIKIYPNPSNGKLFIEGSDFIEGSELKICDVLGKELRSEKLKTEKTELNIAELSNGIYFIKVMKNDKVVFTQKLIKQ